LPIIKNVFKNTSEKKFIDDDAGFVVTFGLALRAILMEEKIKNYNGINISDQDNKNNVKKIL